MQMLMLAGEQFYTRYKISYFAHAMQKDNDKFYGVFRSKKYWRQALDDPEGGEWVSTIVLQIMIVTLVS